MQEIRLEALQMCIVTVSESGADNPYLSISWPYLKAQLRPATEDYEMDECGFNNTLPLDTQHDQFCLNSTASFHNG